VLQRHPQVQWIIFQPMAGGWYELRCEACGGQATLHGSRADAFTRAHAQHQSASPTHRGLGDAVAAVAKPLARLMGRPESCLPCEQKRHALNAAVPAVPFWRR